MSRTNQPPTHIKLTSHPAPGVRRATLNWGVADPKQRGPVVASQADSSKRNAIGAHSGSYSLYRALAVAAGSLNPMHKPDLTDTAPAAEIGPYPQWQDAAKIVSLDPFGHMVSEAFKDEIAEGADVRPTIAVTKAHLNMPEITEAMAAGRLQADGEVLSAAGNVRVTKVAIEPVWYLPGIAARLGIAESDLRRSLFEHAGGMFGELVTRPDLQIFLPPIGGISVYIVGDISAIADPQRRLACRVHDECNGSDVFGSDICTCRPYLAHGLEVCIACAQQGGAGLLVYNRKEGRALGEVTKFLVYNARKRQQGGDRAETYFQRTECVAGVQDMRFQQLMPDVLHWLGVSRIDQFISMSDMKYDALVEQGIEVVDRIPIPDALIPQDASVEMDAKRAAGYFTHSVPSEEALRRASGRRLDE